MKVVALREAKATLSRCVDAAQSDRVLITKHGKPAALVIGVEGESLEDLLTVANPRFWELVESRRRAVKTVPISEVRRRLRVPSRAKTRKRERGRMPGSIGGTGCLLRAWRGGKRLQCSTAEARVCARAALSGNRIAWSRLAPTASDSVSIVSPLFDVRIGGAIGYKKIGAREPKLPPRSWGFRIDECTRANPRAGWSIG